MKKYILSIDQGTSSSTALLLDTNGKMVALESQSFKQIYPKEGWVEQDPLDILKSVQKAIRKLFKNQSIKAEQILSIGITNQRETVVMWDRKTGEPLYNAIVWQCRRTTEKTETMKKEGLAKWIHKKTGLTLDPYFSGTKMEWLLKNIKKKHQDVYIGTVDSYLIWSMTGGKSFVTEPSNASRTQLLNLKKRQWDKDLLDYFSVSSDMLPEVLTSDGDFGVIDDFKPLSNGTPINAVLGDQQSSLYAHGAFKAGEVKCTYGTGSFILMNLKDQIKLSKSGLLTTVAWDLKNRGPSYALEGGAFNCASSLNWLKDQMGLIKKSSDIGRYASEVATSHGVLFAPTLSGLGAPIWSPKTRGAFVGLSLGAQKEHLCRAVLEGLSYQNELIFKAMEQDFKGRIERIYVDGGASQSDEFMRIQAKLFQRKVHRPENIETTALGVGYLSGLAGGVFKSLNEIKKLNPIEKKYSAKATQADLQTVAHYDQFFEALNDSPFTAF